MGDQIKSNTSSRLARSSRAALATLAASILSFAGIVARADAVAPAFTSAVLLQTPANSSNPSAWIYDSVSVQAGVPGRVTLSNRPSSATHWATNGAGVVLGELPSLITQFSHAYGINNAGQTIGDAAFTSPVSRAVRWQADGTAVLLGDVPGPIGTHQSFGYGINNAAQAAGQTILLAPTGQSHRAVRWAADGSATQLGDVPGLSLYESVGYNINDAGQVIGAAYGGGANKAVRWEANGSATVLNNPAGPAPFQIVANGINNNGEAVGWVDQVNTDFTYQAVRWAANGSATFLGGVTGVPTFFSHAYAITDSGWVAGSADLSHGLNDTRGVIWDAAGNGALLQNLMADGNTWRFDNALGIDADATTMRVLAFGSKNGGPNAYYLVTAPVPEPSVAALLGLAVPFLLHRRVWCAKPSRSAQHPPR